MVQAGASMGHFQQGECGIDIVLGYGDYIDEQAVDEFVFDLAYARAPHAQINLSGITDEYRRKRIREQCTQFLDVAAFYGFHVENGTVSVKEGANRVRKKGEAIYTELVSSFHTKHVL